MSRASWSCWGVGGLGVGDGDGDGEWLGVGDGECRGDGETDGFGECDGLDGVLLTARLTRAVGADVGAGGATVNGAVGAADGVFEACVATIEGDGLGDAVAGLLGVLEG